MFYHLNKNVKFLRKKSKFTIPFLASKIGITASALTNFEGGSRNTSLEVLDKLHQIFNIPLDDLVYKDLEKGE